MLAASRAVPRLARAAHAQVALHFGDALVAMSGAASVANAAAASDDVAAAWQVTTTDAATAVLRAAERAQIAERVQVVRTESKILVVLPHKVVQLCMQFTF